MDFLALINARSGSKGIKNKNKKKLLGKPLVQWTFEFAISQKLLFKNIMLSSDDKEIKLMAEKMGIYAPFLRPKSLSQDDSLQIDVIRHALNYYENNHDHKIDAVVLLQPTCPKRTVKDLKACLNLFKLNNVDNVLTVCKSKQNLLNSLYKKNKDLFHQRFKKTLKGNNRQSNENLYKRVGSIYIIKSNLIKKGKLYGTKIKALEIDQINSFDIDDEFDWKINEFILQLT